MTSKIYGPADRGRIVDLLTKYDDELATIAELVRVRDNAATCDTKLDVSVNATHYLLSIDELIGVYERRVAHIEGELANKGIELRATPEMTTLPSIARALGERSDVDRVTESVTSA